MQLVVVGGQCRNVGKTALVCEILRAFAECEWTAVKITQCKENECPVNGLNCGCPGDEHRFAISEEQDRSGRGDSSRFLAAGAARSLWVRVKPGQLVAAWLELRRKLAAATQVIVESNSVLEFAEPDLYLIVLDPAKSDFKASARAQLGRADAFVFRTADGSRRDSFAAVGSLLANKPTFVPRRGGSASPELLDLVRTRVFASRVR